MDPVIHAEAEAQRPFAAGEDVNAIERFGFYVLVGCLFVIVVGIMGAAELVSAL